MDLPSIFPKLPEDWPFPIVDKDIEEVLVEGRWIRIMKGSYYDFTDEGEDWVVFLSEDGKHRYETSRRHIQMKVVHGH